ncbi:MAG: DUF2294 domain-containing protein [Desulfobacterales bacterium]|nr:DUF2294 domain-containing protein [Desulfobacterales bacterium]
MDRGVRLAKGKSRFINGGTRLVQKKSKGQLEAEISNALIAFEKEHMGRGPVDVRSHIIEDMVLIRLKGVLTPAEQHLAKDADGIQLIKQVRAKLLENSSKMLEDVIMGITGIRVVSFHTDISTRAGERVIIITFEQNVEKKFV